MTNGAKEESAIACLQAILEAGPCKETLKSLMRCPAPISSSALKPHRCFFQLYFASKSLFQCICEMILSGEVTLLCREAEIANGHLDVLSDALSELQTDTQLVLSTGVVLSSGERVILDGELIVLSHTNLVGITETEVALSPRVVLSC